MGNQLDKILDEMLDEFFTGEQATQPSGSDVAKAAVKKFGKNNLKKRIRFVFTFSAIIDLIAILPSLIALIYPSVDLRFIRALRIVRLLKFSRYSF